MTFLLGLTVFTTVRQTWLLHLGSMSIDHGFSDGVTSDSAIHQGDLVRSRCVFRIWVHR